MTLYVRTRTAASSDVVVLALSGTPADDVLALLADGVAELTIAGQTVALDLDELVMTRAAAMRAFLARLLAKSVEERIILQCGRLSGRQVLRRWASDDVVIVRTLVDDHRADRTGLGVTSTPGALAKRSRGHSWARASVTGGADGYGNGRG